MVQLQVLLNTTMDNLFLYKVGNFVMSWATINFSWTTILREDSYLGEELNLYVPSPSIQTCTYETRLNGTIMLLTVILKLVFSYWLKLQTWCCVRYNSCIEEFRGLFRVSNLYV